MVRRFKKIPNAAAHDGKKKIPPRVTVLAQHDADVKR
jgi:hypothetical protein